ncbi:hypothetical protein DFH28DRAFT_950013 [Melampsora americana]|nr:hypothetical protein DFH28DRAFT_950013 [Melampsora americana]
MIPTFKYLAGFSLFLLCWIFRGKKRKNNCGLCRLLASVSFYFLNFTSFLNKKGEC